MNKYYVVSFTGGVTKKVMVKENQSLNALIQDYLLKQNKGEAKSDRLHVKHLVEVSENNYKKHLLFTQSISTI